MGLAVLLKIVTLVRAAVAAGLLTALAVLPYALYGGWALHQERLRYERPPAALTAPELPERSVILAADGSTVATFYEENRVVVPLGRIAPVMGRAVVAIEDSRFYEHGALDAKGTLRALLANLRAGSVSQGGSTLSQQYVKNVLAETATSAADRRRALVPTPGRKLRELRYAVGVEKRLTKARILEGYLNVAYFGDGAYGVEAAARRYFGTDASRLTLARAALLAGVVRSPRSYSPTRHPDAARRRRNVVLDRMAELRTLTRAEAERAKAEPLGLRITDTPNGCAQSRAPFFCDYVRREILTDPRFGHRLQDRRRLLWRGGLVVHSTLEPALQRAAQRAVDRHVPPGNAARKAAAEVLVRPYTGAISALALDRRMGGGPGGSWIDYAADADHGGGVGMPAGSTFKVFTLAAALEAGTTFGSRRHAPHRYVPRGLVDCGGRPVRGGPVTNSGDGRGGRTLSVAAGTWHSVNTLYLRLEEEAGLCATARTAERLGMRRADGTPLRQVPSLTLGPDPVSPVRLAAAYAGLAARGRYCPPTAIQRVDGPRGPLPAPGPGCRRALDGETADAVTHVLRGVLTKGTARGNGIGRPAAGKTGTVDGFSAAWFAGYTPNLAGAVWVGDPRGGYAHPLRDVCLGGRCFDEVHGADIPAPIWRDTMTEALRGAPLYAFQEPPGRYFGHREG